MLPLTQRDFHTLIAMRGYAIISSIPINDISELKETEVFAQNRKRGS